MEFEDGAGRDPARDAGRRAGDSGRERRGGVEDVVAAALREIEGVRAERATIPVRSARLTLAAVYGATRLARKLEREAATA